MMTGEALIMNVRDFRDGRYFHDIFLSGYKTRPLAKERAAGLLVK